MARRNNSRDIVNDMDGFAGRVPVREGSFFCTIAMLKEGRCGRMYNYHAEQAYAQTSLTPNASYLHV